MTWTPPPDADPHAILDEARDDRAAMRYEDALARQVWFHRNALAIEPSLVGVRTSYALEDWIRLARRYAPAMAALRAERDLAATEVRCGPDLQESFRDAAAINRALDDDASTRELFLVVESRAPDLARKRYRDAQAALIATGDYARCGHYLDPDRQLDEAIGMHERLKVPASLEDDVETAQMIEEIREGHFAREAGTIVAVLVLSGRMDDARRIARRLEALERPGPLKAVLERALEGELPEESPTKAERDAMRDEMP
jgi:hypothetical protein